jgi:uncharacterized membrane protein
VAEIMNNRGQFGDMEFSIPGVLFAIITAMVAAMMERYAQMSLFWVIATFVVTLILSYFIIYARMFND